MFEKEMLIDAKGHIMGRLASVIAKAILNGQRVVVVRVEQLTLSGSLFRRRCDYLEFKNKNSNTNPRHGGPHHYRSPSKMFWRVIRGMVPHKTKRGAAALEKLKIFEGCPYPYSHRKRKCVPLALKVMRLKTGRKSCLLGLLSERVGWNQAKVVKRLEEKREARASEYFTNKTSLNKSVGKLVNGMSEVQKLRNELANYGY